MTDYNFTKLASDIWEVTLKLLTNTELVNEFSDLIFTSLHQEYQQGAI